MIKSSFAFPVLAAVFLVLNGFQVFGQTPITTKDDAWTVSYRVKVTGDFQVEPEIGKEGPTVTYHIDRTYQGKSTMYFEPNSGKPDSEINSPSFSSRTTDFQITINDSRNSTTDPLCNEYQTVNETWEGIESKVARFPVLLLIDNQTRKYKTSFPVLYPDEYVGSDPLKHFAETATISSGKKKITSSQTKYIDFTFHTAPDVKGYLERNSIIRAPEWSELKKSEGSESLVWISEVLHPDEPLFEGVPESKDKVNIVILYYLTKGK